VAPHFSIGRGQVSRFFTKKAPREWGLGGGAKKARLGLGARIKRACDSNRAGARIVPSLKKSKEARKPPSRLHGRRSYAAPWPPMTVRPVPTE
jgi:hypothetical protein